MIYLAYTSTLLSITEESQVGNSNSTGSQRQELMKRSREELLTSLLSMACSAHLIELRTTSPEMVPPTMGWALPH